MRKICGSNVLTLGACKIFYTGLCGLLFTAGVNVRAFTRFNTMYLLPFFHCQKSAFISCSQGILHSIHKTYNNRQQINILVISRAAV
jgi:hypothetical protein